MEKTRPSSTSLYSKCESNIHIHKQIVTLLFINLTALFVCFKMLNIFQKFVTEQNYSYLKLEGTTSIGSRQPIINKFNKVTSFLISFCFEMKNVIFSRTHQYLL